MTTRRLNPLRWPLTVKIPLARGGAHGGGGARHLQRRSAPPGRGPGDCICEDLADSYLDGLSAAVQPNLLRRDIWETFDALDRARGLYRALQTKYALVSLKDGTILAASDPIALSHRQADAGGAGPDASRPATAWCSTRAQGSPGCDEPCGRIRSRSAASWRSSTSPAFFGFGARCCGPLCWSMPAWSLCSAWRAMRSCGGCCGPSRS